MSDLPTVQVPANQTLETNVKVPHKHRGGTYLRKHLGVGAHKGDRNAQRLLKSRKYYSLSRDEFHCIADLDFTFPVHLSLLFRTACPLLNRSQMLSLSSESSSEQHSSVSSHSRERQSLRCQQLPSQTRELNQIWELSNLLLIHPLCST